MKQILFLAIAVFMLFTPAMAEEATESHRGPHMAAIAAGEAAGTHACCSHAQEKTSETHTCRCRAEGKVGEDHVCCKEGKAKSETSHSCQRAEGKGCGGCTRHAEAEKTAASGCCSAHAATRSVTQADISNPQTMCPVMNRKINKDHYVDHDGKRVYVCCPGCLRSVRENPEKYIKELEDKGITLETVPSAS
jgi:YHS domain-containing protein